VRLLPTSPDPLQKHTPFFPAKETPFSARKSLNIFLNIEFFFIIIVFSPPSFCKGFDPFLAEAKEVRRRMILSAQSYLAVVLYDLSPLPRRRHFARWSSA